MSGKKGMKVYPVEVKLEAVRLFLEGMHTRAEITQLLGLRSPGRVETWVRQYRREGEMALYRVQGRPRKERDEQARIQQLEMEVTLLKKYHTELRKSLLARRNIGLSGTTEETTK